MTQLEGGAMGKNNPGNMKNVDGSWKQLNSPAEYQASQRAWLQRRWNEGYRTTSEAVAGEGANMGGGGQTPAGEPAVITSKSSEMKVPALDRRRFNDIQAAKQRIIAAKRAIEARKESVGLKFQLTPDWMAQRLDPNGVQQRAMLANIGSQFIHDRSGAAVTISEMPRLKPFIASAGDEPGAIGNKLDSMLLNLQEDEDALLDMYTDENGNSPLRPRGNADAPNRNTPPPRDKTAPSNAGSSPPSGVTATEWQHMTPQERALWAK